MYVVKLLMAITSLYFIEGYSARSELRFLYCLLMRIENSCFMDLNRYYLLVGVDIPKFIFPQNSYQLEKKNISIAESLLMCQYCMMHVTLLYHSV